MITIKEMELSDKDKFNEFSARYKAECGEEVIPFSLNPKELPYEEFYENIKALSCKETLPEGWVPARYFLIWNDERIVGATNIRYEDSEFILNYAGHIGYCIAPWERRKGYATSALGLMLSVARSLGMSEVLLTCDLTNTASRKVIISNGGVLENRGEQKGFYWINL